MIRDRAHRCTRLKMKGAQWFSDKFARGFPSLGLIAFLLTSFIFYLPGGPMLYTPLCVNLWIGLKEILTIWRFDVKGLKFFNCLKVVVSDVLFHLELLCKKEEREFGEVILHRQVAQGGFVFFAELLLAWKKLFSQFATLVWKMELLTIS